MAKKIKVTDQQRDLIAAILSMGKSIGEDVRMTSVMLGHLVSTRSGALLDLELKETAQSYAKLVQAGHKCEA